VITDIAKSSQMAECLTEFFDLLGTGWVEIQASLSLVSDSQN
jgi:hypothetical protein